ncbi:MAG: cytochrome b [Rickettsiaceae bacterium]|nr:cytochrome b [Rickettsiaceae bacterium]
MITNTTKSYGFIAKLFHWVTALLVITLLTAGFIMTNMENSPQKYEIYGIHKATGVVVLIIGLTRLLWKILNTPVLPPAGLPLIFSLMAKLTHFALYFFLILMPFSGLMMSLYAGYDVNIYNFFTISSFQKSLPISNLFHKIHIFSAWILVSLVCLHIGAAFFHFFVRKDQVMQRMI